MTLVRKIQALSISKDGTEINLQDTTGVYDVGLNPTGYGGVNPSVFSEAHLIVQRYDGSSVQTGSRVGQPLWVDGLARIISTADLGSSKKTSFPDGVLTIASLFVGSVAVAVTQTSERILAGVDMSSLLTADAVAFLKPDGSKGFSYIDKSKVNTSTILNLVSDPLVPVTQVYPVHIASDYILNITLGERLLTGKIGEYAETDHFSPEIEEKLLSVYMDKLAAEVKFNCKSYAASDLLGSAIAVKVQLIKED